MSEMTEKGIEMTISGTATGRVGAAAHVRGLIRRSDTLRGFVKSAPVQRQIMTLRAATLVRDRPRFVLRQLGGHGTHRYELRRSGLKFHLRHGSGDVAILNKIFARDRALSSYEPPAEVAAALEAAVAPRILDVGANIGLFGVYAFSRWPAAQITAFEPDPDNFEVLSATVAANDVGDRWAAVAAAVSNAPGELRFAPGHGAKAHIATADDDGTIGVPAIDFFDQRGGGIDLVKMDIEGGEWEILADPRLATLKARAIRLEWHVLRCPEPDARETAIRLLRAAGFSRIVDGDREHERNGVLWAWREPASG
jgi:FkbM family methyltransferase